MTSVLSNDSSLTNVGVSLDAEESVMPLSSTVVFDRESSSRPLGLFETRLSR